MPRARSQTVMHVITGHTVHIRVRASLGRLVCPITGTPVPPLLDWCIRDCNGKRVERRRGMPVPSLWHGGAAYRDDDLRWAVRFVLAGFFYRTGAPLTGHTSDDDSISCVMGTLTRGAWSQRKAA